jgi:HK97 gp10 family phage protein
MPKIGFVGYGSKEFEFAVGRFERRIIREVKRIVAETAEKIAAQAKALAPVAEIDGGNLRNSIEVIYYKGGLTAEVRSGANYSIFIEFGTGIHAEKGNGRKDGWVYYDEKLREFRFTMGMPPQPFWRPSLEVGRKYFNEELRKLG